MRHWTTSRTQTNSALFVSPLRAADETKHVCDPTKPRQDYVRTEDLPAAFTWGDKDGVNYLTKSLNQHIPQCE
eukprot:SAG22_NODE_288_length_12949_cov_163.316265_15_plen_73_part_00